jgi:hypothetical protein
MKIPLVSSQKNYLIPNADLKTKWSYQFAPANRLVSEWRTELQLAAQQIVLMAYANGYETVHLVCDKSYESQMMIQAFQWIQARIVVIIPRFSNNDNSQNIGPITMMCEENRIPYTFCDLDVRSFLTQNHAVELAKKAQTVHLPMLVSTLIWNAVKDQKSFLVFPYGMPRLFRNDKGWMIEENTSDYGLMRIQGFNPKAHEQNPGVPLFFRWAPEVVNAYLNDFLVRQIVANERGVSRIDDNLQAEIYKRYFPVIGNRNWNGFEKMEMEAKRFFQGTKGQVVHVANHIPYADYMDHLRMKPQVVPTPPGNGGKPATTGKPAGGKAPAGARGGNVKAPA